MANEEDVERGNDNDLSRGQAVLVARAEQIKAMPLPNKPQGVNLERAAFGGLETVDRVNALQLGPRLGGLPADLYDAHCLEQVEELSLALLVTSREVTQSPDPEGAVSEDLLDDCNTLRSEMITVLRYALEDDEDAMVRIAKIISGSGHKDRVSDLANLGDLYTEKAAVLAERGGARYKPEDAQRAAELATRLRKAITGTVLADSPLARAWKLYVLLEAAHQELLDGVWFLLRRENREPWPGLRALSRRPAKRKVVAVA